MVSRETIFMLKKFKSKIQETNLNLILANDVRQIDPVIMTTPYSLVLHEHPN